MKNAPWWASIVIAALSVVGTWLAKPDASAQRAASQDQAVVVLLDALKDCRSNRTND